MSEGERMEAILPLLAVLHCSPRISTFWSSLSACLTCSTLRWLLTYIRFTSRFLLASNHSNLAGDFNSRQAQSLLSHPRFTDSCPVASVGDDSFRVHRASEELRLTSDHQLSKYSVLR